MLGKESLSAQGLEHSLVACGLDPPQDGLTMRGDSCGCSYYLNVRLSRDLAHLQNPKYLALKNPTGEHLSSVPSFTQDGSSLDSFCFYRGI